MSLSLENPVGSAVSVQERGNICRFWDPESGLWLLLPLQWEKNAEFGKAPVQRVTVRNMVHGDVTTWAAAY